MEDEVSDLILYNVYSILSVTKNTYIHDTSEFQQQFYYLDAFMNRNLRFKFI